MARPPFWHLDRAQYPFSVDVPPRYSDLDPLGHVNNVAIAGLFETGRVAFHRQLDTHPREQRLRWLVAAVSLNYLKEMHYPQDISVASGFLRIGNSSWTNLSAAFQAGQCCATCETVVVGQGPEARRAVGDTLRARMEPYFVTDPDAPPPDPRS